MKQCKLCKKKLKEGRYCDSCRAFLEWKYGSLDAYEEAAEDKQ